jgi:glycosyltransferase involved in cell wall biosynthesis
MVERPESTGAAPNTSARGRIVMLVDNGIAGDSRVQKSAYSAAEAGWDVVVIGKLGDATLDTWRIGRAEARLIPVGTNLAVPRFQLRRSLRRPLAYPPGRTSAYRLQWLKARRTDVAMRLALVKAARRAPLASLRTRSRLLLSRAALKIASGWVRLRARQTRQLQHARKSPGSLLNRLPVVIWSAVMGRGCWRRLDPSLWEWELAFGKVIDQLQPDLIHAHDFKMIGVGARAAVRARAKGRPVKFVYDAHEYVPGLRPRMPRWLPAQCAYEREFMPYADAVVTVSTALAEMLQAEHGLRQLPAVVMNAPVAAPVEDDGGTRTPDLRAMCGIGPSTPLLAYSGGITPVRGLDLAVEALQHLPGVHLALLSIHPTGINAVAEELLAYATKLEVADRVHLLPYVSHWQVARVLAVADAAVSPLHHLVNHEIALSNKFFEYSQARLPMIVSDVRTMAEMVRSTGQGEVFRAQDLADYVRAVKAVLADPRRYRSAYDRPGLLESWTWEAQARTLDEVYASLLPGRRSAVRQQPNRPAGPQPVSVTVERPHRHGRLSL